ncbi:hypothetical protein PCANC_11415 [Puccinia coronata f. sp. avenae]|uniref:Nudix hydrolase domain-containing protein n=1 Tax=Puccinia coronata f. sp. avenae TaxID=200324 RepID=A0A2N5SNL5_9BASI|nr:hypothetical protein PCANC_18186 [Puccinia coronata f. sp. avenae]PLW51176.1 hypothetical protein PCANC_11415 [Puccinia coronata f. sp. avenae]
MLSTSQTPPSKSNTFDTPYIREHANQDTWQALHLLSQLPDPHIDLNSLPSRGVAAVLVLLHLVPRTGDLAVTLTTRSQHLRSHPGDTALPGGRVDLTDESVVSAALREANEEIGLPIDDMSQYSYLGTMEPFLSRNLLVVYPILYLYLLSSEQLLSNLKANEDEVSAIFHIPLKSLLEATVESPESTCTILDRSLIYSHRDLKWIHAYNISDPGFGSFKAPGQQDWKTLVDWALAGQGGGEGDEHSIIRKSKSTA